MIAKFSILLFYGQDIKQSYSEIKKAFLVKAMRQKLSSNKKAYDGDVELVDLM